ncbi:endospore germination permease [Paenibacillus sp. FSL H8-0537]|uniref:GerAB/ArcD/ProY family transporter n=1 Tax=Paenibacillus sp. FSL H8-0537 TaxID=2921399 RepID=UPI003100ECB9
MQQQRQTISARQLAILVILFVIGDMQLYLPPLTAAFAKQSAWMSGVIGIPFGVGAAWFIFSFSKRFPGKTLIDINNQAFGKIAGGLLSLVFLVMMFNQSITQVREIADFVSTQMMTETPQLVICLLLVLPITLAIRGGITTIGRLGEVIFPLFSVLFILLIILLIPKIDLTQLLPIEVTGLSGVVKGALFFIVFPFCEMFAFLMIFESVEESEHAARDYLLAALAAGIAIWSVIVLCICVLGVYTTEHTIYSPYVMAKKINIGDFVQRLEAVLAIDYIISAYFRSIIFGYTFIRGLQQLFKLQDHRFIMRPFGFLIVGYAYFLAPGVVAFVQFDVVWLFWVFSYSPGLLLLSYIAARLRQGWSKKGEDWREAGETGD